jgi:hypothetical protein
VPDACCLFAGRQPLSRTGGPAARFAAALRVGEPRGGAPPSDESRHRGAARFVGDVRMETGPAADSYRTGLRPSQSSQRS